MPFLPPLRRRRLVAAVAGVLALVVGYAVIEWVASSGSVGVGAGAAAPLDDYAVKCDAARVQAATADSTGRVCADQDAGASGLSYRGHAADAMEAAEGGHLGAGTSGLFGDLADLTPVPPLVVVTAGMPRSLTTWVYNAVRLLMMEKDPNLIAGWYSDLLEIADKYMTPAGRLARYCDRKRPFEILRTLQTSMLVKVHKYTEWAGGFADAGLQRKDGVHAVLLTHRHVADVAKSLRLQGNWTSMMSLAHIEGDGFCERYFNPDPLYNRAMTEADWAHPREWVTVARRWIACYKVLTVATDPSILHELAFDEIVRPGIGGGGGRGSSVLSRERDTLRRIAHLLTRAANGAPAWAFTEEDIARAHRKLLLLKQPPCSPGEFELHPGSHLHRNHRHARQGETDVEASGVAAIGGDPVVRDWLRSRGYAAP